jgi:proteasome assembly chaperone 2
MKTLSSVQAVPAAGNTGQLATDLLVGHYRCRLVGVLESDNVLPIVGNDPYVLSHKDAQGVMSSSIEMFVCDSAHQEKNCFLIQQRGPVAIGRQAAFAVEMAAFIKRHGFSHVLLVSSLNASERDDCDIQGPQLCVCGSSDTPSYLQTRLQASGIPLWQNISDGHPVNNRKCSPW